MAINYFYYILCVLILDFCFSDEDQRGEDEIFVLNVSLHMSLDFILKLSVIEFLFNSCFIQLVFYNHTCSQYNQYCIIINSISQKKRKSSFISSLSTFSWHHDIPLLHAHVPVFQTPVFYNYPQCYNFIYFP